jgi:hypothetical protein
MKTKRHRWSEMGWSTRTFRCDRCGIYGTATGTIADGLLKNSWIHGGKNIELMYVLTWRQENLVNRFLILLTRLFRS